MDVDRQALERGILLFRQGRHIDAEREFRRQLTMDVGDATTHAWLAMALLDQKKLDEAERESGEAILNDPELPWAQFAMASVLRERGRLPQAHAAIDEAIRLDGGFTSLYLGTKANLFLMQRKNRDALDTANAGLAIDPDDDFCLNVRALAQTQLGMKQEAVATIRGALERNPEDAFTHANHGWAKLHQNRPGEALDHFTEAMKLDPNNEFARAGLVEALKAKNPIYRAMLAYFLWIGRQSGAVQTIVFIAVLLGPRLFRGIAREHPHLAPYAYTAAGLLYAFVLMTWLAIPIFNSLLRLHPRGRYALDDDQRRDSTLFLGAVVALLAVASVGLITQEVFWAIVAAAGALILLPLSAIYRCPSGWPRMVMIFTVLGLVGLMTAFIIGVVTSSMTDETLTMLATVYFISAFASQFIALAMSRRKS